MALRLSGISYCSEMSRWKLHENDHEMAAYFRPRRVERRFYNSKGKYVQETIDIFTKQCKITAFYTKKRIPHRQFYSSTTTTN